MKLYKACLTVQFLNLSISVISLIKNRLIYQGRQNTPMRPAMGEILLHYCASQKCKNDFSSQRPQLALLNA